MKKAIEAIADSLKNFGFADALLIAVFACVIYYLLVFLRRNNASKLSAFVLLIIFCAGLVTLVDERINGEFFIILTIIIISMIFTVFSAEFKRDIWDIKRKGRYLETSITGADSEEIERCINEIVKALQNMSKNDIGAIMILSRGNVPPQILESGVIIDSDISSQIIESVFFPKSPLHDGAMLINGKKILAAGCFLPLSQEVNLPKELGTRHRAGIGITETLNVTALIVSEETGIISIAQQGKLTRYADSDMLKDKLKEYYWQGFANENRKRKGVV